jgi:hypothetical protein
MGFVAETVAALVAKTIAPTKRTPSAIESAHLPLGLLIPVPPDACLVVMPVCASPAARKLCRERGPPHRAAPYRIAGRWVVVATAVLLWRLSLWLQG